MAPDIGFENAIAFHKGGGRLFCRCKDSSRQPGQHGSAKNTGFRGTWANKRHAENIGAELQTGIGFRAAARGNEFGGIDPEMDQRFETAHEVQRRSFANSLENFATTGVRLQTDDDTGSLQRVMRRWVEMW